METANLALKQLKFSGVHQQRFRKYSSLYCSQEDASFCNMTHILYYPYKKSRRVNKSSDLTSLSCHASSNKNEIVVKPNKKVSVTKRKCIENTVGSIEACSYSKNSQSISSNIVPGKVGVLLLNLGGPETLDDVQPFLFNLFADPVMIFFSAHGVPLSYVEDAGDPYRDQMEDCISLIMDELKSTRVMNNNTLSYQSRVGLFQWLKPYTDEVIVELGQKGVKSLLTVPISFVSEHIETLEEIDMEYKHLALESGIINWGRVPALGCTSSFISDLADAVIEAIPSATAISTERSHANHADKDPLDYIRSLFFGSFLAFFLLLSPRLLCVQEQPPLTNILQRLPFCISVPNAYF